MGYLVVLTAASSSSRLSSPLRIEAAGVKVSLDWFRYLIARYEPMDIPQQQMVGFMQSMFAQQMMKNHMVKSTAISDAGLTKQSLYEVERSQFTPATYDPAREA